MTQTPKNSPDAPTTTFPAAGDRIPTETANAPGTATEAQKQASDYSEYYAQCAARIGDAAPYLQDIGITLQTAQAAGIGYDPDADPTNAPGGSGAPRLTAPRLIVPTCPGQYIARRTDGGTLFPEVNGGEDMPGVFNLQAIYNGGVVFIVEEWAEALTLLEYGQAAAALIDNVNVAQILEQLRDRPAEGTRFICAAGRDTSSALCEWLQSLGYCAVQADFGENINQLWVSNPIQFDKQVRQAVAEAESATIKNDVLSNFLQAAESDAYRPMPTGQKFFDDLLDGGIVKQSLMLLLAAPATGKTTLCQQIAEGMAARGIPVLYLCLEMSPEQMIAKGLSRMLARTETPLSAAGVMQGYRWTPAQKKAVYEAADRYRREIMPFIRYNPEGTSSDLDDIRAYLTATGERAAAQGFRAPVVILDYLHLVSSKKGLDVKELIKQAVEALKRYAIDYDTAAVAIVATGRDSMKGGAVTMNSGRDSSAIEYTADIMLGMNFTAVDNGDVKPSDENEMDKLQNAPLRDMTLRVLKNRFGVAGRKTELLFDAADNRFYKSGDLIPDKGEDNPFTAKPVTRRF